VPPADRAPSLTVLYLATGAGDTSDVALAEGITEELITRLSDVTGLHVTSRYAALRFRGRGRGPADPQRVGRELGVRYVLQGTLRRAGDRVRVAVEVTEAATGYNVWAHSYDEPLRDVFALQDSVAVQVAEAVRGRLTGVERARLVAAPPTSSDAYRAYLAGRAAIRARTAAAAARAIASYHRAIALDSSFAPAFAGLAHAYNVAADWGWDLPGVTYDRFGPLAERAAARAVALDSTTGDTWLGAAMGARSESPELGLEYNRRAAHLDVTNIEALHQLAWGYYGTGQLDSAIAIEQRVPTLDPYFAYAYAGVAELLNVAGRPLEALAWAAQGLAIDSLLPALYRHSADADLRLGRWAAGRAAAERALALGDVPAPNRALAAIAWLEAGDTARARALADSLGITLRAKLQRSPTGLSRTDAGYLAGAYAQLGQTDSAIAWVERVAPWQRRFHAARFLRHWMYDPLRRDPRLPTLLAGSR
jgi:TolB-like protein